MKYHAYAADEASAKLKPFEYEPDPLGDTEVRIKVEACGIYHSDISVWKNEWGFSTFPFVPGHEIVGIVEETGRLVQGVQASQRGMRGDGVHFESVEGQ